MNFTEEEKRINNILKHILMQYHIGETIYVLDLEANWFQAKPLQKDYIKYAKKMAYQKYQLMDCAIYVQQFFWSKMYLWKKSVIF